MRHIRSDIPVVVDITDFVSHIPMKPETYDEFKEKIIYMISERISYLEWTVRNFMFHITITGSLLECCDIDRDTLKQHITDLSFKGRYPFCIHLKLNSLSRNTNEDIIITLRHVHSNVPHNTIKTDKIIIHYG